MGGSLGSAFDPQVFSSAVSDTAFGRVWVWRLVLAAVALALSLRRRPGGSWSLVIVSGLLLASVALTGHSSMPSGWLRALHQAADAGHLLAAGWWTGGLLALALAAKTFGDRAASVLGRFSGVGYAAVAVIVATGVLKSAILLASVPALVSSNYGRVLLIKVGLFACMGVLALSNRLQITPALERGEDSHRWSKRLKGQVTAEFILGLAVLAVVGALGAMQPPIST
jgi:copper resistance protein D